MKIKIGLKELLNMTTKSKDYSSGYWCIKDYLTLEILIVFLIIVCTQAINLDPLDLRKDSGINFTYTENGEGTIKSMDEIYKKFKSDLKSSSLNEYSNLSSRLENKNITVIGEGEVYDIIELRFNYSIIVKRLNEWGKIDFIAIRVPFDKQDDFVKQLEKGEKIQFSGKFHFIKEIGYKDKEAVNQKPFQTFHEIGLFLKWGEVTYVN